MRKTNRKYISYSLEDTSDTLAKLHQFMEDWGVSQEGDATKMIVQAFAKALGGDLSKFLSLIGGAGGQAPSVPPPSPTPIAENKPVAPAPPIAPATVAPPVAKRAGLNGHGRARGNADSVELDL